MKADNTQQDTYHLDEQRQSHVSLSSGKSKSLDFRAVMMEKTRQVLFKISNGIAEGQQIGFVLQIAVDGIADVLGTQSVWFASFNAKKEVINHYVTSFFGTSPDRSFSYEDLWTGICGEALRTCEPIIKADEEAILALPVQYGHELLGVLSVGADGNPINFDEEVIQFVSIVVNQISTVLYHKRLFDDMQSRSVKMETAAEVARATTSILGLDELLPRSVEVIRDRFNYYYVGIFLMDDANEWAVLRAGTGEYGSLMLANEHKLHRDSDSMIGMCVSSAAPRISLDVTQELNRYANPMLPDTRSEMALPLVSRGVVIGAMTIQSTEVAAFTSSDITVLQTMADQLANAIQNAQLYAISQENIQELQRLQQKYALEGWSEFIGEKDVLGFNYDLNEVSPLMAFEQVDMTQFTKNCGTFINNGVTGGDGAMLRHALNVRGQPVGLMSFEEPGIAKEWSEDQIVIMDAVSEQLELALENRLLIERSQRALHEAQQREAELEFLQEISALLNATNDLADASVELLNQIDRFSSLNHLVVVSYNQQTEALSVLTGKGVGIDVYSDWTDRSTIDNSGLGWVFQQNDIVIQDDIRITPRFLEEIPLANKGVLARILLPLRLGTRVLGVLELGSEQVGVFSRPGVLPILQQVSTQVASALERGNLLNVAQENARESQTLYEVTRELAEAKDATAILKSFFTHVFPDIDAIADIGVFATDPETGVSRDWFEIVASIANTSTHKGMPVGARFRNSEVPALHLLDEDHLFTSEDIRLDERIDNVTRSHYAEQEVESLIVLELGMAGAKSERIGLLQVRFLEKFKLSEKDLRLYRTIADQTAVVLSNRHMFQEAESRVRRQAAAVDFANLTTSLSERESLLNESVNFLKQRFDLHFAGIFLLDELDQWAVLRSGTGEVGERLLLMGYRNQVDGISLVAQCVKQGHRSMNLDLSPEQALLENPLLPEFESVLVFPLVSRGQTNGAITLQRKQRFAFTKEDIATLELMVNQLANVIESANLYERSQNSLAETRMLYRIAQQITDARDAKAVLEAAVEGLSRRSEPEWITAGLLEPKDDPTDLKIVVSWSRFGTPPPIKAFPLNQIKRIYDVLQTDDRFVTPDATQDPMVDPFLRGIYSELGQRATAMFQIRVRGAQYGTIMIHSCKAREFSTAELNFYENVARQAFVALENISLVEATQEQADRRDILNQVLQTASSSLDMNIIMRDVGKVIATRLDMPTMMWSWNGVAVNAVSVHEAGGVMLLGEEQIPRLSADDMLQIFNVVETREPSHFTFSGFQSTLFEGVQLNFAQKLIEGYAVPLKARNSVYGVMVLGRQEGHEPITAMEIEFLETAAANVSVALETATLYHEAQETADKLKEVDLLKNQFMANMSHELRTPLNSIIGFSRVMLKGIDGPLSEMQETDLNAIYDSGRHLLELINDILDISKVNSGKMEIVFEQVDLKSMIKSVMSTAMGFIKGKSIELRIDVPEDLPTIVADGRRIRQVLMNLLGNAGKFTEEGFITIAATFDSYQVIISVQDTGIGIPADRIHAVFEQFEQVDSSSTRKYGGTGLGVPLSREFVRMHGGDMWIQESIVGQGTTFTFSLPINGPKAVVENKDTLPASPDEMEPAKVIITVDDDESVITLFRRYLEKRGYRVFGLTTGDRVVEEAKRLKPYAITLDVIMPGKDGWSVIHELKSDPETRGIPIIICSIIGETDKALSMGISNYLLKPIAEQDLLDVITSIQQPDTGDYVLVVDDNPDDRKLLRRILENAGYRVQDAEGGQQAIDKIKNKPPHLVILDIMMPEVDGFVVLENLKGNKITRHIPVVVVTAKELTSVEQQLLNRRVQSLLQKGLFDQQQLLTDVSNALDRLANTGAGKHISFVKQSTISGKMIEN